MKDCLRCSHVLFPTVQQIFGDLDGRPFTFFETSLVRPRSWLEKSTLPPVQLVSEAADGRRLDSGGDKMKKLICLLPFPLRARPRNTAPTSGLRSPSRGC
ncbi:uncharacterized protein LOC135100889 isoform X2 [Scylla paramamosain]|uniref:uncharacterized protein LOC135100889 isoform X2 n=1 Tax=Scylla paramamosain TaxID=85552 RepID=UPI0030836195